MTDPTIHQLYCTHCTYGTSAQHRNSGNVKDQPFEYSTRAGSIEQSVSHQTFQQFEKLVFRGLPLPSDAPVNVRRELTGANSPWRRLVIASNPSGCVVAHVTYRTTDTSKPPRTGSYFAHLLLQETADPTDRRWSLSDALQLWGSDFWVVEDHDNLPFDLSPVTDLRRLPGFGAVINDATLVSFLTTPPSGEFHDGEATLSGHELNPSCAIPDRWRRRSVADRVAIFTAVFQNVLKLNLERRERLLVAVEPSVAALMFYGVVRLLPRTGLVDQLSLSTFEPHNDSSSFVLSATDFYDPATSELQPAASRGGVALNTYSNRPVTNESASPYINIMLALLLESSQGPARVDQKRNEFDQLVKSGLQTIREIEQYLGATDLAERYLEAAPAQPVSDREVSGLTQRVARQKFRELVFSKLRAMSDSHELWKALRESPARTISIARVICEEPALPGSESVLKRLCDTIPDRELPRFLDDRLIPTELRLDRLQQEVISTGQLPSACDFLWSQKSGEGTDAPLLEQLFSTLDAGYLQTFCRTLIDAAAAKRDVTNARVLAMLLYMAKAAKTGDHRKRQLLSELLSNPNFAEEEWDSLLRQNELRTLMFEVLPRDDRMLRERLVGMLEGVRHSGNRFPMKLDILKAGQSRLPEGCHAELDVWLQVRSDLYQLRHLDATPQGLLSQLWPGARDRELKELGAKLAADSKRLLENKFDCLTSSEKQAILKPLAASSTVSGQLPKAFLAGLSQGTRDPEKAKRHVDGHINERGTKSTRAKSSTTFSGWALIAIVALAFVSTMVAFLNRDRLVKSMSKDHSSKDANKAVVTAVNPKARDLDAVSQPLLTVPDKGPSEQANKSTKQQPDRNPTDPPAPEIAHSDRKIQPVEIGKSAPSAMDSKQTNHGTPQTPAEAVKSPVPVPHESPSNKSSELKGQSWKPKRIYIAEKEPRGPLLFDAQQITCDWPVIGSVEFLTIHGPYVFKDAVKSSQFTDSTAWPLIVTWENDLSILISVPLPESDGKTPSAKTIALCRISHIPSEKAILAKWPDTFKKESELLESPVRQRLLESWRQCVLGIHFHEQRPERFVSFDNEHVSPHGRKAQEGSQLEFKLSDQAKKHRGVIGALAGNSFVNLGDERSIQIGEEPEALYTGQWALDGWPKIQLAPNATMKFINGVASIEVLICQEFKSPKKDDSTLIRFGKPDTVVQRLSQPEKVSSVDRLQRIFNKAGPSLNALIKNAEEFQGKAKKDGKDLVVEIIQSDLEQINPNSSATSCNEGKRQRYLISQVLCSYFSKQVPEWPKQPTALDSKSEDEKKKQFDFGAEKEKWMKTCNEQILTVKGELDGLDLAAEKKNVNAIKSAFEKRGATIQISFSGVVYRVIEESSDDTNRNGAPVEQVSGKVQRGIAVKIAEFKPASAEDTQ